MPVIMRWANEEKSIYMAEYVGSWTWLELFDSMKAGEKELDQIDHQVDVIHDWSQSRGFPPHPIANARGLIPQMHRNTRTHVHVGCNSFFMSMWRIFTTIYEPIAQSKRFIFADTIDEAREKLRERQAAV